MDVVAVLGAVKRAAKLGCASLTASLPAAHAHTGAPVWWQWNFEPWLVALLLASLLLYALGLYRLWTHAGPGRGIQSLHATAFFAGWLALAFALVTPLDTLGGFLFSAHMVQHELLMVVAAPLLVIGRPLATWTWALRPIDRRIVGRWSQSRSWSALWNLLTDPLTAWALHAIALWSWHIPAAFDAALQSNAWHIAQHGSFFVTALFFWWAVLGHDVRGRHGAGPSFAYLFTTMLHTSALGALLALAETPWYSAYLPFTTALGFDPVQDQQLGGLVMWVPAALAYLFAALAVVGKLLVGRRVAP